MNSVLNNRCCKNRRPKKRCEPADEPSGGGLCDPIPTITDQIPVPLSLIGAPNSASITFDRDVVVNSFVVSVVGGPPFGVVSGSYSYNPANFTATFVASPLITPGSGGNGTVTVVINQGTECERTIIWTFTVQAA